MHNWRKYYTLFKIFETVFHSANCMLSPPSTIPWYPCRKKNTLCLQLHHTTLNLPRKMPEHFSCFRVNYETRLKKASLEFCSERSQALWWCHLWQQMVIHNKTATYLTVFEAASTNCKALATTVFVTTQIWHVPKLPVFDLAGDNNKYGHGP